MQSHRHQRSDDQIREHSPSETEHDDPIEGDLDDGIDDLELVRRLWVHHKWTDEIEERLEAHPTELTECGAKKLRLELCRKVGVDDFIALVAMMLQMILLE